MVKNLPAMQMCVQSLGGEDPVKKEMATSFSNFAWKISWTVEPHGLYRVHGVAKELDMTY